MNPITQITDHLSRVHRLHNGATPYRLSVGGHNFYLRDRDCNYLAKSLGDSEEFEARFTKVCDTMNLLPITAEALRLAVETLDAVHKDLLLIRDQWMAEQAMAGSQGIGVVVSTCRQCCQNSIQSIAEILKS